MTMPEQETSYAAYQSEAQQNCGAVAMSRYANNGCSGDYWQDGCTESRVSLGFEDYYKFRPEHAIPKNHHHIMYECERIYREHGVVKNILDLMVDFTVSNIQISHPQANIQRLGRKWFQRVKGIDVSTKFALGLYLYGTNIVDTYRNKLTVRQKRQLRDKVTAGLSTRFDVLKKQGTVAYKYVFLNPTMVTIMGGPLNQFIGGEPSYGIKLPFEMSRVLDKKPSERTKEEKEMLESIPEEIMDVLKKSDGFHYYKLDRPLDVYHYRKQDWQQWANPIVMSIYRDLKMLEQCQLADIAALEGAINQITVIRLGNFEYNSFPNPEAFAKLKEALLTNVAGGQRLLTWGPDIDIIQSNVDIQAYLDPGKYSHIMEAIYGGMGVPPSMTGTGTAGSGSTNNLVSLRGFVERLTYGRNMLQDFWERQLADFAREMNIKTPFEIEFDIPNLGDVEAEKKLCIELYDRGVVSEEYIQSKFSVVPDLEKTRTVKEKKARDKGTLNRKAGPFNNPERPEECIKNLVEQGRLPVDELGIKSKVTNQVITEDDVLDQGGGDDSDTFQQNRRSVNGRPPGATDQTPRRRRSGDTPVLRASKIWAKAIQKDIAEVINPVILQSFGKKNMRSLNAEQTKDAEYMAVGTLFNMDPAKCSPEDIAEASGKDFNDNLIKSYFQSIEDIEEELARSLSADERRDLAAEIYS